MSQRALVKFVKKYCDLNNIELNILSAGWVLKLTKEATSHYIIGYQFDINSYSTYSICSDKALTSELLSLKGIPNVEHTLFMFPNTPNSPSNWKDMLSMLEQYGKLVCKVNNGTGGKDVYFVDNEKELERVTSLIFNKEQFLSLSPYYKIKNEYRVIILDGIVKTVYLKEIPFLLGDGSSTIAELLSNSELKNLPSEDVVLPLQYVPSNGEKYLLNWKHNLKFGATPILTKDKDTIDNLSRIALNAFHAVGANFASVDVIDDGKGLKVLEINSGVMMEKFSASNKENYDIANTIYSDALDSMFNRR